MDLGDQTLKAFLDAISRPKPAPGTGAAGDVALALAAACAAKAFAISARHVEGAGLEDAAEQARGIADLALAGAQWDVEDFTALIKTHEASAGGALRRDGQAMLELAARLRTLIRTHHGEVSPAMAGDLTAAEALAVAFGTIERRNLRELG